ADLTELLKGLPGDVCPSPHWGYVLKGRMWWRFPDREESFGPGEAFYVEPGHTSGADAGSEFVVFAPSEGMPEVHLPMARHGELDPDAEPLEQRMASPDRPDTRRHPPHAPEGMVELGRFEREVVAEPLGLLVSVGVAPHVHEKGRVVD